MKPANHPPRPGVRREVHSGWLDTLERRREFAAAVNAIKVCGLAAEVHCEGFGTSGDGRFVLFATRRLRASRTE